MKNLEIRKAAFFKELVEKNFKQTLEKNYAEYDVLVKEIHDYIANNNSIQCNYTFNKVLSLEIRNIFVLNGFKVKVNHYLEDEPGSTPKLTTTISW